MAKLTEIGSASKLAQVGLESLQKKVLDAQKQREIAVQNYRTRPQDRGGFLGGVGYLSEKVGAGFMAGVEGVWDFAAGGIADIFGADQWAEEQIANKWFGDWYNTAGDWYNPSEGWQTVGNVAQGIGSSLPALIPSAAVAIGAGIATVASGGAAAPVTVPAAVTVIANLAAIPIAIASAGGQAVSEAYEKTGKLTGEEWGYGALVGVTEGGIEGASTLIGFGAGKIAKALTGTARATTSAAARTGAHSVVSGVLRAAGSVAGDFAAEAVEEGLAEIMSPFYARATYDPNAKNATAEEVAYASIVGGVAGVLLGGVGKAAEGGANIVTATADGKAAFKSGTAKVVLDTAKLVTEAEENHPSGYKVFQQIAKDYRSLEGVDEEKYTNKHYRKLAELKELTAVTRLLPTIEESAVDILMRPNEAAERFAAIGVTNITAEGLTAGLVGVNPNSAEGIYAIRKALSNNPALTAIAVADAAGKMMLQSSENAGVAARGISEEQYNLLQSSQNAGAIAQKLGLGESLEGVDYATFAKAREGYAQTEDGKKYISDTQRAIETANGLKENTDALPEKVGDTARYGRYAIIKDGDRYRIYDYNTGNLSFSLSESQANEFIRRVTGKTEDVKTEGEKTEEKTKAEDKPKETPAESVKRVKKKKAEEQAPPAEKTTEKAVEKAEKNGVAYEGFAYDEKTASDTQKATVAAAELLHKFTPSVKVHVYQTVMDGDKRVVKVNGKAVTELAGVNVTKAPNGFFTQGQHIYIDINAGSGGRGVALFTLSHEITHYLYANAKESFFKIANFLTKKYSKTATSFESLQTDKKEALKRQYEARGEKVPPPLELSMIATEEVVCDSMSRMLTDASFYEVLAEMKGTDTAAHKSFLQALKTTLGRLKELLKSYTFAASGEAGDTVVAFPRKAYRKLQKLYAEALMDAETHAKSKTDTKFSYAGENAATSNKSMLAMAQKMLADGKGSEEIRKQTGWFKGLDGKWRYEIDDSEMKVTVPKGKYPSVGDFVEHKKLFAAYPELAGMFVTIHDIKGKLGSYSRTFGDIQLSADLVSDPEKLREVLVHELQHAVQDIEGFASGATVEAWERKIADGYDSRSRYIKAEESALQERLDHYIREDEHNGTSFVEDMRKLREMAPDHPRGEIDWETLEQIEEDSPEWQAYDKEYERLSDKYGDKVFAFVSMDTRLDELRSKGGRSAMELYLDTAGEIEARDVAKRRNLTAEERKNTRPDIDREDVVFAGDGSVKYFAKNEYDAEKAGIHEQIRNSQDELNQMQVVFTAKTPYKVGKAYEAGTWAIAELKKYGYQADRQGFGKIYFDEESIRDSMKYLDSDEEKISIIGIYKVLKQGIKIGEHGNHKNRGKHTVTFAAPVEINGVRGNMAVVVNMRNNKYKVHRILMPDGSVFKFEEKAKNNAEQEMQRGVPKRSLANATSSASINSIPNSDEKVNPSGKKFSLDLDSDYLSAVERGDMETAQRIVDEAAEEAMRKSKMRTEDGRLRKLYHGTNTGDFTVFNPDYIGMSSGDDGFFGMGFYFAYSRGEASYYGAKRIITAYLNLENPFNFDTELRTYKGERAMAGRAPSAVALMNFAEKFPDIASGMTLDVMERGADTGKSITIEEFSRGFKEVIDNKKFEYHEITNEFGEKETLVSADPTEFEYEYNGAQHKYTDYGFQRRYLSKPNRLDVAYDYLSESVYRYIDMPNFTRVILDNNRAFTDAIKKAGYDGAIQSEYGDEAVAFYPNQIKSADPVTYDDDGNIILPSKRFNTKESDIRYSERDETDEYTEAIMQNLRQAKKMSRYGVREYGSFTADRIAKEIRSSSSTTEMDYAKSYIAWMSPEDFVYATTATSEMRKQIADEAGELDTEKLATYDQPIYLAVDFSTGEIRGHEGRHRMQALKAAGIDKVAVIIDARNDDRKHTKPIDYIRLKGQRFSNGKGLDFSITNALPLSMRYADAAREMFSFDSTVRYSERDDSEFADQLEWVGRDKREYKPSFGERVRDIADRTYAELFDAQIGIERGLVANGMGKQEANALVQRVRSSGSAAQSMLGQDQYNHFGGKHERVGEGLTEILKPTRNWSQTMKDEFDFYLLNWLNVDAMTLEARTTAALQTEIAQAQALSEEIAAMEDGKEKKARQKDLGKLDKKIKAMTRDNRPIFKANEELGRDHDITAEESEAIVKKLEEKHPAFKDVAAKIYGYLQNSMQKRVDAGLVTQEAADRMAFLYPHYVPVQYDIDNGYGFAPIRGAHAMAVSQTIRRAIGGKSAILKVADAIAQQTIELERAGNINILLNSLYPEIDEADTTQEADDVAEDEVSASETAVLKPTAGQITFFKNGERVTVKIPDGVEIGINDLRTPSVDTKNPIERGLAWAMKLFREWVTTYSPVFTPRNAVRDIQDAGLNSKHARLFAKHLRTAPMEILKNSENWRLYRSLGAFSSSVFQDTLGAGEGYAGFESIALMFKDGDITPNKLKKAFKLLGKSGKAYFKAVENVNNFVEQIPRFAEFCASLEAGDSVDVALYNSAEVTTNFGRHGKTTKKLNAVLIPFLNANLQGFDKILRNVGDAVTAPQAVRATASLLTKAILIGMTPMLVNMLMYGDDDEYEALRDTDKENYFLIKISEDSFIKIPRGRVASAVAGILNRGAKIAKGEDPDLKGYAENVWTNLSPVDSMSRDIFSPFRDVASNTTWYGSKIEGQEFDDTRPSERYDESTSSIAIALGKVFNQSPKKIHYLLDQYTGVVGDLILPATSQKENRGLFSGNLTIDSVLSNKWSTKFYELYDETNYKKTDGDEAAAYELKYLNRVKKAVKSVNDEIDAIRTGEGTNGEKLQKVRVLRALVNEQYKSALDSIEAVREAIENTKGIEDETLRDAEITRMVFGAETAIKQYDKKVYEKYSALADAGVSYDDIYDFYFSSYGIESDTDKNGNVIDGSKRKKVFDLINAMDIPVEHKVLLANARGYTVKDGDIKGVSASAARKILGK